MLIVKVWFGCNNITHENIKAVLKRHAPNIEPNGISAVDDESLDPATIAVKTSGALFANAKNVTPANVGDISNFHDFLLKILMKCSTPRARRFVVITLIALKRIRNIGIYNEWKVTPTNVNIMNDSLKTQ